MWEQVPLHSIGSAATDDEQNAEKKDVFTFGVTLLSTGDILFAYKNMPMSIQAIKEKSKVVKIGLSDAYYIFDKREDFFV